MDNASLPSQPLPNGTLLVPISLLHTLLSLEISQFSLDVVVVFQFRAHINVIWGCNLHLTMTRRRQVLQKLELIRQADLSHLIV